MENAICNCHTSKREPHWCQVHGALRETPTRDSTDSALPSRWFRWAYTDEPIVPVAPRATIDG